MELKLFFSWQTETNLQGFKNKNFLIRCIEAAIKNAEKKDGLQGVTIELHEGLRGIAGNSKVSEQMFQQIDECDIFVGDVTTVQRLAERGEIIRNKKCLYFRYSPNCNVYGEYNRALGKSKTFWKQIILVMNEANKSVFDDPDVIPFDTRDTRWPIVFKLEDDSDESKTNAKDELVKALTTAIHRSALEALKSRNTRFEPFITWNIHTEDGRIKNLKIADSVMGKYVPVINGILAVNLTEHKIRQLKTLILCSYGRKKTISEVQDHSGAGTSPRRECRGTQSQAWCNAGRDICVA